MWGPQVTSRLRGMDSTTQGDIPSHNDYVRGRSPSDGDPPSGPLSATAPSPGAAAAATAADGVGSASVKEPATPIASSAADGLAGGAPPAVPDFAVHIDVPVGAAPHDLPPSAFVQVGLPFSAVRRDTQTVYVHHTPNPLYPSCETLCLKLHPMRVYRLLLPPGLWPVHVRLHQVGSGHIGWLGDWLQ